MSQTKTTCSRTKWALLAASGTDVDVHIQTYKLQEREGLGHKTLQGQFDLACSCLGLLGLCAPQSQPQDAAGVTPWDPAWHHSAVALMLGWHSSLRYSGKLPLCGKPLACRIALHSLPCERCSFTSKDYTALSTFYWAHCRVSFLEGRKKGLSSTLFSYSYLIFSFLIAAWK